MRIQALLTMFVFLAISGGAQAQTPRSSRLPLEMSIPVAKLSLSQALGAGQATMNGSGCISGRGAGAAARTVNPINGNLQAQTIVSVPLGKNAPSFVSATQRAQQREACAHSR